MSTTDQVSDEVMELVRDIQFVNTRSAKEIDTIRIELMHRVGESTFSDVEKQSIIDDISVQLGNLTTRLRLCEQAVETLVTKHSALSENPIEIPADEPKLTPATVLILKPTELHFSPNLLPLEYAPDGASFRWSGASPSMKAEFDLDRTTDLEFQIRLYTLIKPEFGKNLRMSFDGRQVNHKSYRKGHSLVVYCPLKKSSGGNKTSLEIMLPSTHSPLELGVSQDDRKLGIAISEVRFCKPKGKLINLLRRFGL